MFASSNKLDFKKSTRKDDLMSLAYMLLFNVCGGTLPFMEEFYNEQPVQNSYTPLESL